MNNTFDFGTQLDVGNDGEAYFAKCYSKLKPKKSKNLTADFILEDGKTVEVKTDTYSMEKTSNFFMEIFGNLEKSKLGGPWRAMQDNIDYFVYLYIKDKTFYWFRTVELCTALDTLVGSGVVQHRDIRNKSWVTRGYVIPRATIEDLAFKQERF